MEASLDAQHGWTDHPCKQFWLRDGHPAYPVFWDFSYVVAGPEGGLVLIGSNSD